MRKQVEKLETDALKLDPKDRARLAEKLLQSLETLSDEENMEIWLEEAERRDAELDANPDLAHPADKVLRDARSKRN
ncbi:MAG: addiction module protein [Candidatus Manganitrophaceae bacterium]